MKITWKMKTMTTEVLFNEDDYVWGDFVEDNLLPLSCEYLQVFHIGPETYYRVGHKKKLQKLEVGKVYTTNKCSQFVCVTKVNNYYYMVDARGYEILPGATAYTWTEDGVSNSLDSHYDVDWSVEPYEMSING